MAAATQQLTATADDAEPYHEQRPFMGLDKRFYGFVSGTGAGKTFAGAYRLWVNSDWWNPDSMGAIIVPDKSQFTDNIKPILEEFGLVGNGDTGLWDYQSVYSDEPGLHTHNDQRILILSADNTRQIGRIKGKNLAYFWMDEEAEIDPRAREIAQQRLRVGQYPNGFITTTPDGYNHTYDFFDGDVDTRKYDHGEATIYEAHDRLAVVGVPPEANPEIQDADIASMRESLPKEIVQQEIEGQFIQIGGGVFQSDMFNWIHPSEAPDSNLKTLIGVDPAATADAQNARDTDSDYWGVTVAMLDQLDSNLLITDSRQRRGMTLTEGVDWIQSIANQCEQQPQLIIESNQSQRWLQQQLAESGLNAIPVQTTRNKEEKLIDLSIPISNGTVQFVEWPDIDDPYQELRNQMLSWPDAAHDDLMDSLALIVNHTDLTSTSIVGGSYRDE